MTIHHHRPRLRDLILPYWTSRESWRGWILLAVKLILTFTSVYVAVWANQLSGQVVDALVKREWDGIWRSLGLSWIAGRNAAHLPAREKLRAGEALLAAVALALLILLLGGVTFGYFYAVEAAAMGAFTMLLTGLGTGRLRLADTDFDTGRTREAGVNRLADKTYAEWRQRLAKQGRTAPSPAVARVEPAR